MKNLSPCRPGHRAPDLARYAGSVFAAAGRIFPAQSKRRGARGAPSALVLMLASVAELRSARQPGAAVPTRASPLAIFPCWAAPCYAHQHLLYIEAAKRMAWGFCYA